MEEEGGGDKDTLHSFTKVIQYNVKKYIFKVNRKNLVGNFVKICISQEMKYSKLQIEEAEETSHKLK